jgi:hypothetical protein
VVTEGDAPSWLPSGSEFVYALDPRRAAVFSLPNTRVLLRDTLPFEKSILSIAVNQHRNEFAVLYRDARRDSIVEIYRYPALALTSTFRVDKILGSIRHDGKRGTFQVSVPDPRFYRWAETTGNPDLVRVGAFAGANVWDAVRTEVGLLTLVTKTSRALVLQKRDGSERTFSYSGDYARPSFSDAGDGVVETRLEDGRLVVALQRWQGVDQIPLTSGPTDAFPSLDQTGRALAFVRVNENTIVACSLEGAEAKTCRPVYADPLGPRGAVLSPDATHIAYNTVYGSSRRLRVVDLRDGKMRDLGMYSGSCSLLWSSPGALWVHSDQQGWREIETSSGESTGRTHAVSDRSCDVMPLRTNPPPPPFSVRRVGTQSFELRLAETL